MEKRQFSKYSDVKRIEMLESNCDAIEEMDYTEILASNELSERKDMLAQRSIEESRILDDKKEIMDEFKEKLKPVTEEKHRLLNEIKHGSVAVFGRCYKFVEGDRVGFYNSKGDLVLERSAKPEERQMTIAGGLRNGTNN
jgi:hypothetical protein